MQRKSSCHCVGQVLDRHSPSRFPDSILLRSDKFFWKCIPQLNDSENIDHLNRRKSDNLKHITFPCDVRRVGPARVKLYKFPTHLPPLHKHEVEECLFDFMTRTATALKELHDIGFAHLDVRVPNICFAKEDGKYIVKLVDLDRCIPNSCGLDLSGYTGEMYHCQRGWRPSQSDWKQLGLLAAAIIFKCSHRNIIKDPRVCGGMCA